MTRILASATLAGVLGATLPGCELVKASERNDALVKRNQQKEAELAEQQRVQQALVARRDELTATLHKRETTAAQMQAQLDRINQSIQQMPANTPREAELRKEQLQKVSEASKEAQALDRNTALSQQEKARQLEVLKKKTADMLKILLSG